MPHHAIVIGASMSGLLTARVLADHFERVTIIERDQISTATEPRYGVPQGRHPHFLLTRGQQALESFFPGFTDDLIGRGAIASDSDGFLMHSDGGYLCRVADGSRDVTMTRPLIEDVVRRRVLDLPKVCLVEEHDTLGLAAKDDATRIVGARVRPRGPDAEECMLSADLVVDATGRGSKAPAWLTALGYDAPTEDQVRVDLTYTTRFFRRPDPPPEVRSYLISPTPNNPRGGAMVAVEDQRWILMLWGYFGDPAPKDADGYRAYARSLAAPAIADIIDHAQPIGDAARYRFSASQRRRYERLRRFPDGFLVIGDAMCGFNPIYGQGMTAATLQAEVLRDCLSDGVNDLAKRFFTRVTSVVDIPWGTVVSGDLAIPAVDGDRTRRIRLENWYTSKVIQAAQRDPRVTATLYRVLGLMDPPTSLVKPGVLARVIRAHLPGRKRSSVIAPQ